jgi:hypothetical protein
MAAPPADDSIDPPIKEFEEFFSQIYEQSDESGFNRPTNPQYNDQRHPEHFS